MLFGPVRSPAERVRRCGRIPRISLPSCGAAGGAEGAGGGLQGQRGRKMGFERGSREVQGFIHDGDPPKTEKEGAGKDEVCFLESEVVAVADTVAVTLVVVVAAAEVRWQRQQMTQKYQLFSPFLKNHCFLGVETPRVVRPFHRHDEKVLLSSPNFSSAVRRTGDAENPVHNVSHSGNIKTPPAQKPHQSLPAFLVL